MEVRCERARCWLSGRGRGRRWEIWGLCVGCVDGDGVESLAVEVAIVGGRAVERFVAAMDGAMVGGAVESAERAMVGVMEGATVGGPAVRTV